MSIIRVKKDARYFSASNEPFNDTRLSWEARGLMGYLLSKPNNWQVRVGDLEKQGPAKEHKLRRMLAELRKAGYMNRIRISSKDGTFDWLTEVFESPSLNPKPATWGFSTSGSSTSGSSTSGKSTDITITDGISTEEEKTKEEEARNPLFSLYENSLGMLTPRIADWLEEAEKTYSFEWVSEAITIAARNGAKSWNYCESILKRWKQEGKSERPSKKQTAAQSGDPNKYIKGEYAHLIEH